MTKATKIVVTLLDVGQGSGSFVEIYTGTTITATALLDLGSDRAKTEAGGPSVNYIVAKLKSMAKPRIDFFSLSHSDSDHINLVQDLLANFDPPATKKPKKTILEIGTVIYGGPRVKYQKHSSNNVISDVEKYQAAGEKTPQPLPAGSTSYSQTAPIFSISEVEFFLLVGNHVAGRVVDPAKNPKKNSWKTDPYSLNTYSLIFVITFVEWRFVITGDATGATISEANKIIDKYNATFPYVAVMTMPHHSSESTTFGLTGSKRKRNDERVSDEAKEVIETFAKSIKPKTLHASAEEADKFKHPSAYTMSYFWGYVDKIAWYDDPALSGKQHLYNAYFTEDDGYKITLKTIDPKTKKIHNKKEPLTPFDDWWTFATPHSIFTNRYYVRHRAYDPDEDETATFPPDPGKVTPIPASGATNSPPFAVAWAYSLDGTTEEITIERLENRKVGTDFVRTPVMLLSKTAPARPPSATAAPDPAEADSAVVPRRTLAPKPPARRDAPFVGPANPPLRRMRSINV